MPKHIFSLFSLDRPAKVIQLFLINFEIYWTYHVNQLLISPGIEVADMNTKFNTVEYSTETMEQISLENVNDWVSSIQYPIDIIHLHHSIQFQQSMANVMFTVSTLNECFLLQFF